MPFRVAINAGMSARHRRLRNLRTAQAAADVTQYTARHATDCSEAPRHVSAARRKIVDLCLMQSK
jgi:hypothetical protein